MGGVSKFSVEKFCLTLSKKLVGEPCSLSLISVVEIFMFQRDMSRFSVENVLSRSIETFHRGTLL